MHLSMLFKAEQLMVHLENMVSAEMSGNFWQGRTKKSYS